MGIEFLNYIYERCKDLNLNANIEIGKCLLPSFTEKNLNFKYMFNNDNIAKENSLDDIKHKGDVYNYQKTKI